MSSLSLKQVKKVYPNGFEAVKNFNIDIEQGEFIVFVGPSGCGKSTTLRMIAGLEEVSSGSLIIGGKEAKNLAPKDRDIAMVFQNYALYAHMTVYHNMAFSLMLRRTNSSIIHSKVMWAAEILGLTPYLNRKPAELSGGQRQRVAVGRSLVRDPKVFLLDEPLSNLDAKLRGSMRNELRDLHDKLKATMIYVTHDQIEALTLADRIVIMDKGYTKQIGTPEEVYNDPQNIFVATFIGSPPMNIFKVVVANNLNLKLDNLIIKTTTSADRAFLQPYIGKEILLGIRPEHIAILEDEIETKEYHSSKIDIFELLGSDALIHLTLGDKKFFIKDKVSKTYQSGEEIKWKFPAEKLYFFDQDTEERINEKK
ncbi:MAG: sn-glycerol-3-phosphate ABC transporter ATP-binding protein UgpC [Acholeplasmatales bacterium]|jgi:multiple sugar transport system ATP-binding protein|nr:sn-glycerol-3-phosphate ABC transporter ATP-binding protein UgpC [Acholeplasmatales bacterium]